MSYQLGPAMGSAKEADGRDTLSLIHFFASPPHTVLSFIFRKLDLAVSKLLYTDIYCICPVNFPHDFLCFGMQRNTFDGRPWTSSVKAVIKLEKPERGS